MITEFKHGAVKSRRHCHSKSFSFSYVSGTEAKCKCHEVARHVTL